MTWQDALLILEAVILFLIYLDDHAMRQMAKESLLISRESLEAQKQYLDLRRKWYESRLKKKDNDKAAVGPSSGSDANAV